MISKIDSRVLLESIFEVLDVDLSKAVVSAMSAVSAVVLAQGSGSSSVFEALILLYSAGQFRLKEVPLVR